MAGVPSQSIARDVAHLAVASVGRQPLQLVAAEVRILQCLQLHVGVGAGLHVGEARHGALDLQAVEQQFAFVESLDGRLQHRRAEPRQIAQLQRGELPRPDEGPQALRAQVGSIGATIFEADEAQQQFGGEPSCSVDERMEGPKSPVLRVRVVAAHHRRMLTLQLRRVDHATREPVAGVAEILHEGVEVQAGRCVRAIEAWSVVRTWRESNLGAHRRCASASLDRTTGAVDRADIAAMPLHPLPCHRS
ncbi:MAG: hypothetical protein ACK501_08650 [Planctomycetota bacterium]